MKIGTILAGALIAAIICIAIWSAPKYPPISLDEIGSCVIADHYKKTGHISYPLAVDVVHPYFKNFVGGSSLGLRAPYYQFLTIIQTIFGTGYKSIRETSVVIWVFIGGLFLIWLKKLINFEVAIMASLLWFLSPNSFLASHLIREDIFICLFLLINIILLTNPIWRNHNWPWLLSGFIGSMAFLGFHPNGIYVVASGVFFLWRRRKELLSTPRSLAVYLVGSLFGTLLCLAQLDIEEYIYSQFSIAHSLYAMRGPIWAERIWPWNLIADTAFFLLRAKSFYFNADQLGVNFWRSTNLAALFVFIGSVCWAMSAKSPRIIKDLSWHSIIGVFVIGLGAGREEYIYRTLLTITICPVIAWSLLDSLKRIKDTNIYSLISVSAGALGVFSQLHLSVIFYLLYFLLILFFMGSRDRTIVVVVLLSCALIFFLYIRDYSWTSAFLRDGWAPLMKTPSLLIASLCLIITFVGARVLSRQQLPYILFTLFLIGGIVYSYLGTLMRISAVTWSTHSLQYSFDELNQLVKRKDVKILGPSFLWFWREGQVNDIGGILLDKYYSGRARARECIDRVRPDILVIDNEFINRYLIQKPLPTSKLEIMPLDNLVSASHSYLGKIPASIHHSPLYIFELEWGPRDTQSLKKS